jgi:hypothetical protein
MLRLSPIEETFLKLAQARSILKLKHERQTQKLHQVKS